MKSSYIPSQAARLSVISRSSHIMRLPSFIRTVRSASSAPRNRRPARLTKSTTCHLPRKCGKWRVKRAAESYISFPTRNLISCSKCATTFTGCDMSVLQTEVTDETKDQPVSTGATTARWARRGGVRNHECAGWRDLPSGRRDSEQAFDNHRSGSRMRPAGDLCHHPTGSIVVAPDITAIASELQEI